MLNRKFPITKCPRCGGQLAEVKQYVHGYGSYYVDLKTGGIDASDIHNSLDYRNTGKYILCANCGKRLFKADDFLNVID